MQNSYSLPSAKARICRIAGAVFLFCAAVSGLAILSAGIVTAPQTHCDETGCVWSSRPSVLLDDDDRLVVQSSPARERAFNAHAKRPIIRLGIMGTMLITEAPFAVLLMGVGLALRRLGGGGDAALPRALRWMRRASQAAIAWAVARPIGDSLLASLLSGGTPAGAQWQITLPVNAIGTALMLGVAAYATVWALEAGLQAQRDLADFV